VLHVETGEQVKAGQLLVEFDLDVIRAAGLSTVTPVIVPGGIDNVLEVIPASPGTVAAGIGKALQVKVALQEIL
jgi:PTS system sucrose-specific IIC component